jgi:streptogrisin C
MRKSLLVLSSLSLAVAMSASAADRVSPVLRAAMQRDLGLSSTQLNQYLRVESLAIAHQDKLAAAQGRNFGGSWIEQKADGSFRLVVATTGIGPRIAPDGVEYRHVRYNLADLKGSKAQIDSMVERGGKVPKGVYSWYVDQKTNALVIGIGKGGGRAAVEFVARSGANADHVRFVHEEQARKLATLQGGHGYLRNPGDGYLYACSIGFTVTTGYVSAGHCGDAGEPVFLEGSAGTGPQWTLGPQIGAFSKSSFPGAGQSGPDYSYIATNASQTLSPVVYGWGKGNVTVKGSTAVGVGAAICRSGRTSGWRCGTIDQVDVSVTYGTGETITHTNRTTACSEGGDSGGSFVTAAGQGQGVLSGGSGSCKGKQPNNRTRSYFQPLNPILSAYNLTLKTG